jgi:hypothetical protein
VLPFDFLPQADFDRLLWRCDINFVRGEDSFVRAQWATHPFVWQIYQQDDDTHLVKLKRLSGALHPGIKCFSDECYGQPL